MKKKFIIAFITSIICFTLLYSTVLSSLFFDKPAVATDDKPNQTVEIEPEADTKVKNEIMFLLMGVDAQNVKKSKGTRTDTMMLTRVNFETGEINILSIPRDTRLSVKGNLDKVNAAHAYGGPELSIDTIRDFLGIDLEYYVKVDYQIVQDVVEAIGGVEIDVPMNMKYNDPTADPPLNINLKKGLQTLNGKQAHDFLRFRHNNSYTVGYPEGDVGRIKSQQYFVKELVKQTLTAKNIVKIPSLIKTYYENVETNIPLTLMLKSAASAGKINVESMETATIPGAGEYIKGISYYIYNREETNTLVNEMFGEYVLD
ncbi:LCP family protein [Tissierella sp. Yu-01]|uniref:LCP family protein n=1 Tax=Tissierella sp. Yu-01 TaxID=3035694 RepID=UPI00240E380E|nr:LCP family protein [Tissierella sp. Yu-01]WFA08117.1 LCP family protein [Tissierella sp. Yu-01]